jgi:hypothetical protein
MEMLFFHYLNTGSKGIFFNMEMLYGWLCSCQGPEIKLPSFDSSELPFGRSESPFSRSEVSPFSRSNFTPLETSILHSLLGECYLLISRFSSI